MIPAPLATSETTGTRVALITGAAQGIGRSIALRLASDGFDVALNDISSNSHLLAELINEIKSAGNGRQAVAVPGDVSVEAEVEWIVEQTVELLGSLDVVSYRLRAESVIVKIVVEWITIENKC